MKSILKNITLLLFISISNFSFGQNWIDTTFDIATEMDITYGVATNFAGASETLKFDISYPENDLPTDCGRPLMVIIHGGAWFAGDKNEGYSRLLRQDFAKRGYVTASVNYRLGQFNTNQHINCNIPDWNCYNMTDSSEWYRANYRGIQDVNGAIRYLVNQADEYQIDPNNVYVVGESAGAFIAMGVGFLDDDSEVLENLVDTYPDAPAPNSLYENACIQNYGLADDIASMDLSRPALGHYRGTLNLPLLNEYKIRAVGSIYGGVFNNILTSFEESPPSLYLYHQPCDLIVPYNYGKLLAGYNNCLSQFPTSCGSIVNRPFAHGSNGITKLIDTLVANSIPTNAYYLDNSSNNYNCFQQLDPNLGCHAIDNYWLRTTNMATYFADFVAPCSITMSSNPTIAQESMIENIYPNPFSDMLNISFSENVSQVNIKIVNVLGEVKSELNFSNPAKIELPLDHLSNGAYYFIFTTNEVQEVKSFIKI